MFHVFLFVAVCKEIDEGKNSSTCTGEGKQMRSGFNIGFDPDYWIRWCGLLNKLPSPPVLSAAKMMQSQDENFMKNQPKLRYTKGNIWLFLKAESKDDSEKLLAVSFNYMSIFVIA